MGEGDGQGGPPEEVTFEQRPGGSEGWSLFKIWGKSFQMEGTGCAKALGWEGRWCISGIRRVSVTGPHAERMEEGNRWGRGQ